MHLWVSIMQALPAPTIRYADVYAMLACISLCIPESQNNGKEGARGWSRCLRRLTASECAPLSYLCMDVCRNTYVRICMYMCMCVCLCVCGRARVRVCVYVYAYIHAYIHACIHVCIHAYIHMHAYMHFSRTPWYTIVPCLYGRHDSLGDLTHYRRHDSL